MTTLTGNSVKDSRQTNTELAGNLIREYKQTKWVQNSDKIGKPDALSARFSIEEMEEFLAAAKQHGGDGVKFYYGAFPENFEAIPEYSGRQTLVMVATKTKKTTTGDEMVKDIYVTKNGKAKILSGLIPKMCPPTCMNGNDGGMGDLGITIVDRGNNGMEIV
jgi:hypothetical protein